MNYSSDKEIIIKTSTTQIAETRPFRRLGMAQADAPPAYEIITIPAFGEEGRDVMKQECYDVRIDVFHHEQGFPLDTEIDE